MFRERQKLRMVAPCAVYDKELVRDEKTGYSEQHLVDACRSLPDAENFDLGTLVEAGVPLKKVNCTVIDSRPRDVTQFEGLGDDEPSDDNDKTSTDNNKE